MTEDWSDNDDIKVLENPEVTFTRKFNLHISRLILKIWKCQEMAAKHNWQNLYFRLSVLILFDIKCSQKKKKKKHSR